MTQAVRFHELGGPEVLGIEEVSVPEPGQDEVALKVEAVGLNRAESMYYHGQYFEQPQFPAGLGYEAVGVVTAMLAPAILSSSRRRHQVLGWPRSRS